MQDSYFEYLDKVSEKGFENVPTDNMSFLTDPLTFASELRGRPILMINALSDKYIPKEAATDLWQACGHPQIKWISAGHTSIWLHYFAIRKTILAFLKSSGIIGVSV